MTLNSFYQFKFNPYHLTENSDTSPSSLFNEEVNNDNNNKLNKSCERLPSINELFQDFLLPGPKIILKENININSEQPKNNSKNKIKTSIQLSNIISTGRVKKSPYQESVLNSIFESNPFPNSNLRKDLAELLNLSPRKIQIWFQNRRQKLKLLAKQNF